MQNIAEGTLAWIPKGSFKIHPQVLMYTAVVISKLASFRKSPAWLTAWQGPGHSIPQCLFNFIIAISHKC